MIEINNRHYRRPARSTVIVCLDGSSQDYIDAAVQAGAAPFLASLLAADQCCVALAAMPTLTNPNNLSIVTGVPPAMHGISGNYCLDRRTGGAVLMNEPEFLRVPTVLAAFAESGAKVSVAVAKDKLRRLVGAGLAGTCISAEQEGAPVYSDELSTHVLRRGVELLRTERPDILYLSTSDFIQHAHAPGTEAANAFFAKIDAQLAIIDDLDVNLVITADHGMNSKTCDDGRARVIYLQELCDRWVGSNAATVILPITDPYVGHHGSLGSFAWVYSESAAKTIAIIRELSRTQGVELVLPGTDACHRFELPRDRTGDIAVVADRDHVIGTRATEHHLSGLHGPLRSHGGLAEQAVPLLYNRPLRGELLARLRNYDAFWLALNAL